MKEWHERRARYRSLELEAKVGFNLCMVARKKESATGGRRLLTDGHDLTSLLDHIFNGMVKIVMKRVI